MVAGTGLLFAFLLAVLAIEYGALSALVPPLRTIRASTLLGWAVTIGVVYKFGLRSLAEYTQNRLVLTIVIWTGMSVLWAVVRTYVPANFRSMCDYGGLFLGTLYLVDRPSRIKALAILMSGVIIHLVLWNLDNLNSAIRFGAFRAAYFMGDGNDFGWGLVTLMLFPAYLVSSRSGMVWRLLGLGALGAGMFGVMGTQSRGATLAVLASTGFYWLFLSRRKSRDLVLAGALLVGAIAVAPPSYLSRMQTLENYSDDNSAQGRLRAWGAAIRMAFDYPLGVGAGNFNSAYGRYYRPSNLTGWASNRWISAHSVYFKVLGEYGFGGLLVLLALIGTSLAEAVRCVRRIRATPEAFPFEAAWPGALGLGLTGYAVGGAFLGGVAYPHLFMVTGLIIAIRRVTEGACAALPQVSSRVETSWRPVLGATRGVAGHGLLKARNVMAGRGTHAGLR